MDRNYRISEIEKNERKKIERIKNEIKKNQKNGNRTKWKKRFKKKIVEIWNIQ